MKLRFIGSGSAFTVGANNYQSNMILESNGKNLLIDCGTDAKIALFELGYTYKDIDALYVSHLHADHVGGIEWLAYTHYFDEKLKKPALFLCDLIENDLWEKVLVGGLRSVDVKNPKLSTYFKLKSVKKNSSFIWEDTRFYIVPTIHVNAKYNQMPSYGLFFKADGKNVFITTDSQLCPEQIGDFLIKADLIFHDCETMKVKTGVHAHYDELKKLPEEIKSKMWLYHYNPGKLPNAKKDGFKGFVKKGQLFNFRDQRTL